MHLSLVATIEGKRPGILFERYLPVGLSLSAYLSVFSGKASGLVNLCAKSSDGSCLFFRLGWRTKTNDKAYAWSAEAQTDPSSSPTKRADPK